MSPYHRAPHQGGAGVSTSDSPHAALLIDFDNVTMGMRSDLSKELKHLLSSDIIHGKVSVQRAYADWRRYPQYIVPLSEASVDLIFAPAYGANKKNATDIRMAIDAVELVFVRPEIGTYILLTGDSDFSSLVLKLKEYGKYVIGVGIRESSSDILVQNCDEYYSYTTLAGLTKTTETDQRPKDPWVLVTEAVKKMAARSDVMRSDRLKQVMVEMDPTFDEGGFGFSKFSRFLAEASSRGLVALKKMENGQYEVAPSKAAHRGREHQDRGGRRDRDRGERGRERERGHGRRDRKPRGADTPEARVEAESGVRRGEAERGASGPLDPDPMHAAYDLLRRAMAALTEDGRHPARDSDVKRKLLELDRSFDEAELGFPKFSRFLRQAHDHEIITLRKGEGGNYEVMLEAMEVEAPASEEPKPDVQAPHAPEARGEEAPTARHPAAEVAEDRDSGAEAPAVVEILPSESDRGPLTLGPRRGSTRRRGAPRGPVLLEGQAVMAGGSKRNAPAPDTSGSPAGSRSGAPDSSPDSGDFDASALGLPTDPEAIVRYLANRYRGVGEKTAETLVDRFGSDLFRVLRDEPDTVGSVVPAKRAGQVLEAWHSDYARRTNPPGADS